MGFAGVELVAGLVVKPGRKGSSGGIWSCRVEERDSFSVARDLGLGDDIARIGRPEDSVDVGD